MVPESLFEAYKAGTGREAPNENPELLKPIDRMRVVIKITLKKKREKFSQKKKIILAWLDFLFFALSYFVCNLLKI